MPLDPQNRVQTRDRELRVWDLFLKGLEGVEIARREGVDPSVISRIKTRVERRITAETDGKAQSLKARQIAEIRRARREAWDAWDDSRKPAAKTTRRSVGRGSATTEQHEIKAQSGNPAFLDKVYEGLRLEVRLTGTEAPVQQQIENRVTLEDLVAGSWATPMIKRVDGNRD
jgi:hypothetical protein